MLASAYITVVLVSERLPPNADSSVIRTGFSNAAQATDLRTDELGCQFVGMVQIKAGHRQEIAAL